MRGYSIIVVILFFCVTGCPSSNENDVVVIRDTKSYHKDGCPPTVMARTERMPKDSALQQGMNPCPNCMNEEAKGK